MYGAIFTILSAAAAMLIVSAILGRFIETFRRSAGDENFYLEQTLSQLQREASDLRNAFEKR